MLRKKLLLAVKESLARPPFIYPEDFRIRVDDREKDKTTNLRIEYLCDDGQYFVASIPHQRSTKGFNDDFTIAVKTKPGEITDTQNDSVDGEYGLLSHITQWTARIQEDLNAAPEFRAAEEISKRMNEIEDRLDEIPDQIATPEQVQKLHELLNELERSLKTQIELLELSVQEKEKRINELKSQFDAFHKKAEGSNVKTMLRLIVSRVYRFATDPDLPKLIENAKRIGGMLGNSSPQE